MAITAIPKAAVWGLIHRAERALNVDLIPRRYWSPIPFNLADDHWHTKAGMAGIDWNLEKQRAYLATIRPHMLRSERLHQISGNRHYAGADAAILYATVKFYAPARIIELGSGLSTRIIQEAIADGHLDTVHDAYDPYPGITGTLTPGFDIHPVATQDMPLETFDNLASGDILFVDTTHTVKAGSDVNRVVLEILPRLQLGVVVHIHDVFLPYEYPREWLTEKRLYWAEQYLLQAFLSGNQEWEVLLGSHALSRTGDLEGGPSSLWMRKGQRSEPATPTKTDDLVSARPHVRTFSD